MRSRRWLIAVIAATALSACLAAAAPHLVRRAAESKLAARGLTAEIDSVSLRPTRVWLTGVRITSAKLPSLDVRLDAVEVRYSLSGPRSVSLHGGNAHLAGSVDEVRSAFDTAHPEVADGSSSGGGGALPIDARGLFIEWQLSEDEAYSAWGVSLRRDASRLELGADLVRGRRGSASLELSGLRTALRTPELGIIELGAAKTDVSLRLDASQPAAARAPPSPPASASASAGLPFGFEPGRGARLRAQLRQLAQSVARRLPEGGEVGLDHVSVVVQRRAQALNLGPARLRVSRGVADVVVELTQSEAAARDHAFDATLSLPLQDGEVKVSASAGPASLSHLGIREGDFGLTAVGSTTLRLELDAKISADGERATLDTNGALRDLNLFHPKLSPEVLSGMALSWSGEGELLLDGSRLHIERGQLTFGAVSASARLSLERNESRLFVDAGVEVPTASCQDMFDSLPQGAIGLLAGTKFSGTFSWNAALKLDTNELSKIDARWRMNNRCRLDWVPAEVAPERFKQPFTRLVPGTDGDALTIYSGPGTADWYPLDQISRYMEVAVLTTEDGGFWRHRGFDQGAIEASIRQNLQTGRYARGASTISMQLAKNLYLSRDKFLTRKIQEGLLTMLLEQELEKAEILELYFNIVEFGPDVWGIGMAADHYFNAKPAELSLAQSFFLASLLPSPRVERFVEGGALDPRWAEYLRRLMKIAHSRHRITDAELAEGLAQQVQFGVPNLYADDEWQDGDEDYAERAPGEPDWDAELQTAP